MFHILTELEESPPASDNLPHDFVCETARSFWNPQSQEIISLSCFFAHGALFEHDIVRIYSAWQRQTSRSAVMRQNDVGLQPNGIGIPVNSVISSSVNLADHVIMHVQPSN